MPDDELNPNVVRVENLRKNKNNIPIKKDLENKKCHLLKDILIVPKATSYKKDGVNYRLLSLVEACDNFHRITNDLPPWCIIGFSNGKIQYCAENFIIIEGEHYLLQHKVAYMVVTPDTSGSGTTNEVSNCYHGLPQLIEDGKYKWFKSPKNIKDFSCKAIITEAETKATFESKKNKSIRYEYNGVWFNGEHKSNKFPEDYFYEFDKLDNFDKSATYFLFKVCKKRNFEDACNRVWSVGTRLGLQVWGTPAPWYSEYASTKKENYDWYKDNGIKHVVIFEDTCQVEEDKEFTKRQIKTTIIPIEDFCIPTIGNILDLIKVLLNCPEDSRAAMHCTAGQGRTGFMMLCLKKLLSPIDGLDFDYISEELGVDYRWGAKTEIKEDGDLKEERKKLSDKQMADKIQKAGGVCRYKYFRFVGGKISSTPDDNLALKGLGKWEFDKEKNGTTWNIILSLPGETLEAMYVLYGDDTKDTWNSGSAKGLRKFIKRKDTTKPDLNYYECVLPKWSPSTKMIADNKNVDNGLPWE